MVRLGFRGIGVKYEGCRRIDTAKAMKMMVETTASAYTMESKAATETTADSGSKLDKPANWGRWAVRFRYH